ncbi:MAG: hypothetical protein BGO33_07880 [Bacteroidia bacterium 43-41]|nr:MAG: hypothetical protein BGO33_07880 [Bacteroidia bacterium 43-41]
MGVWNSSMILKKILFRVDAGDQVGLGHYYRSLNLALTLKERGHEIVFVHLPSAFWDNLKEFPFKHCVLSFESAEYEMVSICLKEKIDIFYADGIIPFTSQFIHEVKKKAKVVFYQNLSGSKHLANVFILPSIHQDDVFWRAFDGSGTTIYRGLQYFTFNREIEKYTPKNFTLRSNLEKIAVIAGGSDPGNVLLTLYEMLDEELLQKASFTFFYGNDYLHEEKIPVRLKKNTSFQQYKIRKILSHDVLIAAFGVSAYEFMYLGMPVIGLGHQEANADALKVVARKTGAIYDLGAIDHIQKETFNKTISSLLQDKDKLEDISQKAKQLLDIRGVYRVADILENL